MKECSVFIFRVKQFTSLREQLGPEDEDTVALQNVYTV
jgi:hypothetical protein